MAFKDGNPKLYRVLNMVLTNALSMKYIQNATFHTLSEDKLCWILTQACYYKVSTFDDMQQINKQNKSKEESLIR